MGNSLLFQDTVLLHIVISIYEFVHCLIPWNLTHPQGNMPELPRHRVGVHPLPPPLPPPHPTPQKKREKCTSKNSEEINFPSRSMKSSLIKKPAFLNQKCKSNLAPDDLKLVLNSMSRKKTLQTRIMMSCGTNSLMKVRIWLRITGISSI